MVTPSVWKPDSISTFGFCKLFIFLTLQCVQIKQLTICKLKDIIMLKHINNISIAYFINIYTPIFKCILFIYLIIIYNCFIRKYYIINYYYSMIEYGFGTWFEVYRCALYFIIITYVFAFS